MNNLFPKLLFYIFFTAGVVTAHFQIILAQTINAQKLTSVQASSSPDEILQFNETATSIGAYKGQFFSKTPKGEKVIYSNGMEKFLREDLEGVVHLSTDYIIIEETDHPLYPSVYKIHVYDNLGSELFSLQNEGNFYIYPTGTGMFIREFSQRFSAKPLTLFNSAGDSIRSLNVAYRVNDFRKIYASPDRSFFVINAGSTLIAIDASGNELWRVSGLRSSLQLGVSSEKVAIGAWGGKIAVFNKKGEELSSYKIRFSGDSAVTFSDDGKYLAALAVARAGDDDSAGYKYIYLFDDEKQSLVENWPIVPYGYKGKRSIPRRVSLFDNKMIVTFAVRKEKFFRIYDFAGNQLFETSITKMDLDDRHVSEIYSSNRHLQILTSGSGLIYRIYK